MSTIERPRQKAVWLSRDKWSGADGRVRDDVMDEINSLSQIIEPLGPDDVIVKGMWLMNTLPMHESYNFVRRFDRAAVEQTADMVRGKPVLANHSTEGPDGLPLGRFFRAEVEHREDGTSHMAALFFMLNDEDGQRINRKINGGIISENSPTLEFDRVYCSICGESGRKCDHEPGDLYEGKKAYTVMTDIVDFWEGSLAWAGMQQQTSFFVAAGRDPSRIVTMDEYWASLRRPRAPRGGWDGYWQNSTEH